MKCIVTIGILLAAAPAAAQPATTDADANIDLAALGLDPSSPVFDDKLQIYGFADFNYQYLRSSSPFIPTTHAFYVGNVNLYFKKNLTPRWRALAEVRLLFTPNGSVNPDGTSTSTAAADVTNNERTISWGGISIERAYLEYDITSWLTVRAGHWLTPYGIWNIDHGSPTIIGAVRPYIVGEQFFPEHQTGIQAFGAKVVGDYRVEYHATLSNGRNPYEATRDPDGRPAVGGRLAIEAPWAGTVKFGVSAYGGRATQSPTVIFDEVAVGIDASWDHGGLHVQGEWLTQQRWYMAGKRAPSPTGFIADGHVQGFYTLAGYRFSSLGNAMPYAMFEHYRPFDHVQFEGVDAVTAGINLRPTATVVMKAEYTRAVLAPGEGLFADQTIDIIRLQTAWVF